MTAELTATDRREIADVRTASRMPLEQREWPALRDVFVPEAGCDHGSGGHPDDADSVIPLLSRSPSRIDAT